MSDLKQPCILKKNVVLTRMCFICVPFVSHLILISSRELWKTSDCFHRKLHLSSFSQFLPSFAGLQLEHQCKPHNSISLFFVYQQIPLFHRHGSGRVSHPVSVLEPLHALSLQKIWKNLLNSGPKNSLVFNEAGEWGVEKCCHCLIAYI